MNFQQLSIRLRKESRVSLRGLDYVLHLATQALTEQIFTKYNPDTQYMKLTPHLRQLDSNLLITLLECFFPEYMKGVKIEHVELIETGEDSCPLLLR